MAPEAVRQAVGGVRQSGWGRLLSVTNATEAGTWRQGDSGWAEAGRPGGGGYVSPFQCIPDREGAGGTLASLGCSEGAQGGPPGLPRSTVGALSG